MPNSLQSKYANIRLSFQDYWEMDFQNEAAGTDASVHIRYLLRDFVLEAMASGEAGLARQAIAFLLENTGCGEDLEIYDDIRVAWLSSGLISESELQALEGESSMPAKRWM